MESSKPAAASVFNIASARLGSFITALSVISRQKAVAEGVENEAIMALLRELGCDEAQGFHLGRPMPAAEMPGFALQWAGQPVVVPEAVEKTDTTASPALV